jgi:Kyakuja-Dileera-Zisupton transposase
MQINPLIQTFSAKYPLATISHLLDVLPDHLGLGYDIACSFSTTLRRSSIGEKASKQGLRLVVPGFHGHAHNRLCQLSFHILMSEGYGLEDLETCERVFSASNAVARLTRHATQFHRRQFIDLFFRQWDAEKYEHLGISTSAVMLPELTIGLYRHFFTPQLSTSSGDASGDAHPHP